MRRSDTRHDSALWRQIAPLLFLAAVAAFGLVACGNKESRENDRTMQPRTPEQIVADLEHGIDVSDHSGVIDWDSVAAQGYKFVFLKATEGEDLKDSLFDAHWPVLKEKGFVRGAYHFYVTEDEPDTMAAFFIQNVTLEPGDFAPVVDIETIGHNTPPGLRDRFARFLGLLENHYGIKPIIYTTAKFWNEHLKADFSEYPLWVAEYEVDQPTLPEGWTDYHIWQWQGDAIVPGVEKGADISRVNKNHGELAELIIGE